MEAWFRKPIGGGVFTVLHEEHLDPFIFGREIVLLLAFADALPGVLASGQVDHHDKLFSGDAFPGFLRGYRFGSEG